MDYTKCPMSMFHLWPTRDSSIVRRKSDCGRESVGLAGIAWNFGQQFTVRKLSSMWRTLRRERMPRRYEREKEERGSSRCHFSWME
jgi:hypothetical protein